MVLLLLVELDEVTLAETTRRFTLSITTADYGAVAFGGGISHRYFS